MDSTKAAPWYPFGSGPPHKHESADTVAKADIALSPALKAGSWDDPLPETKSAPAHPEQSKVASNSTEQAQQAQHTKPSSHQHPHHAQPGHKEPSVFSVALKSEGNEFDKANNLISSALAQGLAVDAIKAVADIKLQGQAKELAVKMFDGNPDAIGLLAKLESSKNAASTLHMAADKGHTPQEASALIASRLSGDEAHLATQGLRVAEAPQKTGPDATLMAKESAPNQAPFVMPKLSLEEALVSHMQKNEFDRESLEYVPTIASAIRDGSLSEQHPEGALVLHKSGDVIATMTSTKDAETIKQPGDSVLAVSTLETIAKHGIVEKDVHTTLEPNREKGASPASLDVAADKPLSAVIPETKAPVVDHSTFAQASAIDTAKPDSNVKNETKAPVVDHSFNGAAVASSDTATKQPNLTTSDAKAPVIDHSSSVTPTAEKHSFLTDILANSEHKAPVEDHSFNAKQVAHADTPMKPDGAQQNAVASSDPSVKQPTVATADSKAPVVDHSSFAAATPASSADKPSMLSSMLSNLEHKVSEVVHSFGSKPSTNAEPSTKQNDTLAPVVDRSSNAPQIAQADTSATKSSAGQAPVVDRSFDR